MVSIPRRIQGTGVVFELYRLPIKRIRDPMRSENANRCKEEICSPFELHPLRYWTSAMLYHGELSNRGGNVLKKAFRPESYLTAFFHLQGLIVPEVLRPYLRGQPEFFEYTKELPKDSTSMKVKGKTDKGPKSKIEPASTDVNGEVSEKLATANIKS